MTEYNYEFLQSQNYQSINETEKVKLPTKYGNFALKVFHADDGDHVVLIKGEVHGKKNVIVRLHSECFTGDIFSSCRCDCGQQLRKSMEFIEKAGEGIILYMRQEGRGIGLVDKIKAYALQENGFDTVEANRKLGFAADLRSYKTGAKILKQLGLSSIRLLTNNPGKIAGLRAEGLKISERIPLIVEPNENNKFYLFTKKQKLRHLI